MMKILSIAVSVVAALSAALFVSSIGDAENAIQEASISATCVAIAVLPYIFVRGLEIARSEGKSTRE